MRVPAGALAVIVVAAMAPIGAAACSGSISQGSFVDEAGSICRATNARFAEIAVVAPTAARAAKALGSVRSIGRAALVALRDLAPPVRHQQDVAAWLEMLDQALDEVAYARALVLDGHTRAALAAARRADLLTGRAQALARRVGLARACHVPRLVPADPDRPQLPGPSTPPT